MAPRPFFLLLFNFCFALFLNLPHIIVFKGGPQRDWPRSAAAVRGAPATATRQLRRARSESLHPSGDRDGRGGTTHQRAPVACGNGAAYGIYIKRY